MSLIGLKHIAALSLCGALTLSLCAPVCAEAENAQEGLADAPQLPVEARVSPWAVAEVEKAYAAGLIPADFDLGEDYRIGMTRGQFARLAVAMYALSKQVEEEALLEEYSVPQGGAEEISITEDSGLALQEGEGAPEEPLYHFADTADPYIELAARLGLVKGKGDGTHFMPEDALSRAEAAVMLQRCLTAAGYPDANLQPKTFADGYKIPKWARESAKYVAGRVTPEHTAVITGIRGDFRPKDTYSVEQGVITLYRSFLSETVEASYAPWRDAAGYDTFDITMSFGGDCTFGRSRTAGYAGSFDEMYDKKGAAYFFSNVKEFHTDDLTMVNFEGALTTCDVPREEKPFVFKGRAEYANILKAGSVDVVTVANNHARDYGNQGLKDTKRNLSKTVAVSGFGDLPILEVQGVKVGFASNLGWAFDASQKKFIQDSMENLRRRGADIIVFNFHWGEEGVYKHNKIQEQIGRYCVDQGADLVIGHHPHVVQDVETYKGRQIVYSLGNLSFGGNRDPRDKKCLIFQETFTVNVDNFSVVKRTPKAIPYRISSVNYKNDYRPTPA